MRISNERVGAHLRLARERAGFTQTAVARRLHMRRPSIGEIERGRRPVKVHELDALAELYSVRPSFLTRGVGPKDEQLVMLVAEELAELQSTDLDRLDRAIRIVRTRRRFRRAP
jgi:transcriptional regulator with XRE-family HTH domain